MGAPRRSTKTRGLEGKKMAHRTETGKALWKAKRCPFNFTFKLDEDTNQWSLLGGTGSCQHEHHSRPPNNSTRKCAEICTALQKDIVELADSSASTLVARRIVSFKSGITLTKDQIHYMLCKHRKSESVEAFSGSSADQLISYLKSRNDISFMCLFDSLDTTLLSTANKGRPTQAQKLFEMKQMSVHVNAEDKVDFNNQQDGDATLPPSLPNAEVLEQELTGIDTDKVFLSAQETRQAL